MTPDYENEDISLELITKEERKFITECINKNGPYDTSYVKKGHYEVIIIGNIFGDKCYDFEFNPFSLPIFYIQESHIGEQETALTIRDPYYINFPIYRFTGKIYLNKEKIELTCQNGLLHNATGKPAIIAEPFIENYYINGRMLSPINYFKEMEYKRKHFYWEFPEYDNDKYIEFMAKTLGK